jgi:hypothetical protein
MKQFFVILAVLAALLGSGAVANAAAVPDTWVEVQGATVPVWGPSGTQIASAGWLTSSPSVWLQCQRLISSWGGYHSWVAVAPSPYKWGWIRNNALGNYVAPNGSYAQVPGVPFC